MKKVDKKTNIGKLLEKGKMGIEEEGSFREEKMEIKAMRKGKGGLKGRQNVFWKENIFEDKEEEEECL